MIKIGKLVNSTENLRRNLYVSCCNEKHYLQEVYQLIDGIA